METYLWLVKISGCSNQLQVVFFLTDVCRFADKCCVASNWRQMQARHSEWIMSTTLWSRESTQLVTSWLCSGYFPVWKQSCKRSLSCRNHIYNVEEFLNFSDLRWEFLSVDGSKFRRLFLVWFSLIKLKAASIRRQLKKLLPISNLRLFHSVGFVQYFSPQPNQSLSLVLLEVSSC